MTTKTWITRIIAIAILSSALSIFAMNTVFAPAKSNAGTWMYLSRVSSFEAFTRDVDVVFVGDSLTNRLEWQDVFPQVDIANRGIEGDSVQGILDRIAAVESVTAQKAFVMTGVNDFLFGGSVEYVFERYSQIIERLTASGSVVYIQSTLDCSGTNCTADVREKIGILNEMLAAYAPSVGAIFIDINPHLATSEAGLRKEFTIDGTHLNADGYKQWIAVIAPFVTG